jgi:transcriptional regulator with XRE-family HTH domain
MILGRRLQEARQTAGLSLDDAAKALRVTPLTIRRLEKAEVGVNYPSLKRRACTTGAIGCGAAFASSGFGGGAGAVDWAPRRHNSHARTRMLRELFRSPVQFRSREDVTRFFDGLELLDPGVTVGHRWRPDAPDGDAPTDAEVSLWTGVGIKP